MKKPTDGIISTTLFLFTNIHCNSAQSNCSFPHKEYCLVGHILALTVQVIIYVVKFMINN